jgi:signal transduction histidine kinase
MNEMKSKILLVDDRQENLDALKGLLKGEALEIRTALSGNEALELLLSEEFALAIVDVRMPGMSGFELAELMRGAERTKTVPIIFVTAGDEAAASFQGYESGAVDFLSKPLNPLLVRSKVRVFVKLHQQKLELKHRVDEVQRKEQDLLEAVRARDEFLSIASHELRTPITSMVLQLQSLRRAIDSGSVNSVHDPKVERLLQLSERQTTRLTGLIDDLLDVTRAAHGRLSFHFEAFDLSELAGEVVERLSNQSQDAGCDVSVELTPGLMGRWDRHRIDQVLVNLVTNALKYGAGCPVLVKTYRSEKRAVIEVIDKGKGIEPENQERIFERFERATRGIAGLGLGLFIVREIARRHGGEVLVESEVGKGSIFRVELPFDASVSGN